MHENQAYDAREANIRGTRSKPATLSAPPDPQASQYHDPRKLFLRTWSGDDLASRPCRCLLILLSVLVLWAPLSLLPDLPDLPCPLCRSLGPLVALSWLGAVAVGLWRPRFRRYNNTDENVATWQSVGGVGSCPPAQGVSLERSPYRPLSAERRGLPFGPEIRDGRNTKNSPSLPRWNKGFF